MEILVNWNVPELTECKYHLIGDTTSICVEIQGTGWRKSLVFRASIPNANLMFVPKELAAAYFYLLFLPQARSKLNCTYEELLSIRTLLFNFNCWDYTFVEIQRESITNEW